MSIIMAVDQSTTSTGVAIGDTKKDLRAFRIGRIRPPRREVFGERLWHIWRELDSIIRDENPDLIVYESPLIIVNRPDQEKVISRAGFLPAEEGQAKRGFHGTSAETGAKLQKVAAIVETLAAAHGIPCDDVAPPTWRKTALGMGRAPKDAPDKFFKTAMINRARELGYNATEDEADAIGILIHAMCGPDAMKRNQGSLLDMVGAKL